MKIAFRSSAAMIGFTDIPKWKHGDVRDVKKARAEYLISTFPDNFLPAEEFANQAKKQAAAERPAGDAAPTSAPGQPAAAGDITGSDTSALTEEEVALFEAASRKIDEGRDLTEAEQEIFDRVEDEGSL